MDDDDWFIEDFEAEHDAEGGPPFRQWWAATCSPQEVDIALKACVTTWQVEQYLAGQAGPPE